MVEGKEKNDGSSGDEREIMVLDKVFLVMVVVGWRRR